MPTYSQLQAEPYWGREVVTEEMDWLGDEMCRRTNRPRTAFGTKGDNAHLRGAHRSQEWIRRSAYCTNRTYTVQTGLTAEQERHVAGADFTPGSAAEMVAQCRRLLAAMKAGQLDEVREFYGNVDGDRVVDGWDNVRDRAASSDSSHLWHWHLTIDRRHCRNRKLMERILAIALGDPLEDDDMTPEELRDRDIWPNPYGDKATNPTIALGTAVRNIGRDTDQALAEVRAVRAGQAAILAAVQGLDTKAVLAAVEAVAADERARDADLAELIRAQDSGELTAEQVLTKLRDLLPAGETPA